MRSADKFLTALLACTLLAPGLCPASADDPPRIGLVLSGGGARGGAHVGVLRALEETGITVDFIAGTSMGAIIGGFYAAGYSPDEIEQLLRDTDWENALSDRPARRDQTMRKKEVESDFLIPYRLGYNNGQLQAQLGAVQGQHLDQIFQRILAPVRGIHDFDRLHIPFRAIATDLVTGDEVVLAKGSLSDSLRASMSVPGVFAPVRIDGRLLVDGGMSNNLPVDRVREMGADVVIAVDISSPMLGEEDLTSVLSVTEQLTNFLTRRNTDRQIALLGPRDLLIVPDLGDFSAADFQNAPEIVRLGREAALKQRDRLAELASERPGEPVRDGIPASPPYSVEFVEIVNDSVLGDEMIRSRLGVQAGDVLDLAELHRSLDRIYSLDVFESVTYDLVEDDKGRQGVRVSANARDWGPNYLQFGLELSNDFSGNSDFKLGAGYTRNALNPLGGELRVVGSIGREDELEFNYYQPVDRRARWFVNPAIAWKRRNYNLWVDDVRLAEFELSGWGMELGAGRNFGTTGQAWLEYRFGRSSADLITGFLPFEIDDQVDIGELILGYRYDSVDSLYFPNSGMQHEWSYRYASDALGAAFDYKQAQGSGVLAGTWGKNTVAFNYSLGYSFDDDAPLERWYQLGGFGRLSGLAPDQLSGRHAALAVLGLYRRLNEVTFLPVYAGMTLEAGNTWLTRKAAGLDDLRYSGSLFLGAESPLGPLYIALGYSDSGDAAVYFYVGNPFRPNQLD